jgi:hypothetical protein
MKNLINKVIEQIAQGTGEFRSVKESFPHADGVTITYDLTPELSSFFMVSFIFEKDELVAVSATPTFNRSYYGMYFTQEYVKIRKDGKELMDKQLNNIWKQIHQAALGFIANNHSRIKRAKQSIAA